MPFLSYAQNFEDVLLWRALASITDGAYIDIGAQDPVINSVSMAFYLRGWRGTHVEPAPFYAARLRRDRLDEPVIEAAVGTRDAPSSFYLIPGTGLSTGIESIADRHRAVGYDPDRIIVQGITLADVLEPYLDRPVHWMKIDVEGMEADAIASWGDSPVRPWVLTIAAPYADRQALSDADWCDAVMSRGYHEVWFDGVNRFFVADDHHELDAAFAEPPNVMDDFCVSETHFSVQQHKGAHDADADGPRGEFAAQAAAHEPLVSVNRARRSEKSRSIAFSLDGETASETRLANAASREIVLGNRHIALLRKCETLREDLLQQREIAIADSAEQLADLAAEKSAYARLREIREGEIRHWAEIKAANDAQTHRSHEQIERLHVNNDDLREDLAKKREALATETTRAQQAESDVANADAAIAALRVDLAALQNANHALAAACNLAEHERRALEREHEAATGARAAAQDDAGRYAGSLECRLAERDEALRATNARLAVMEANYKGAIARCDHADELMIALGDLAGIDEVSWIGFVSHRSARLRRRTAENLLAGWEISKNDFDNAGCIPE